MAIRVSTLLGIQPPGEKSFSRTLWSEHNGNRTADVYDTMFRRRAAEYPEALTLEFWANHPVTQEAKRPGVLGRHVLDVGCGTGEIDIHLARAGFQITSYDLSPVALNVMEEHLQNESPSVQSSVQMVLGVEGPLPFSDQEFDSVLLSHVLEHIAHPTALLKEIARVLKPNGTLLVLTPHLFAYDDPTHVHHFTLDELSSLLSNYFENLEAHLIDDIQQLCVRCSNPDARHYPRIICQMRIKNEERWLKDVLDQIALVADGIVILDDGSTDETPQICQAHPAVIEYHYQDNSQLDEVRDKNLLLEMALKHNPEWVLCMDGDEILEDTAPERIFTAIKHCPPQVSTLDIAFLYMWDDLQHYRTDGIYRRIFHHRLFSLAGQDKEQLTFTPSGYGGNLHCESVPPSLVGQSAEIDVRIKHLGYMHKSDRERKYQWYRQHDPQHAAQGYYEHLLDQPHMTIETWHDRPRRKTVATQTVKPQKLTPAQLRLLDAVCA